MIRQTLFAAVLLAASTGALATGSGHRLHASSDLSISVGSVRHDGFNVTYRLGSPVYLGGVRDFTGHVLHAPPRRVIHEHRHTYRHVVRHDHRRDWGEHHPRRDNRRHWRHRDHDDHRDRHRDDDRRSLR